MAEAEIADAIRSYPANSPEWRNWLSVFPLPPSWTAASVERFIDRLGPYLANRPDPALLTIAERLQLRALFEAYGKFLINDKRVDSWKTIVEIGGITVSTAGWYLGLALLEPVTIGLSVAALVRNTMQERCWTYRKQQLEQFADWVAELVAK